MRRILAPGPEPESIGRRLRRLRQERGLSQRELAEPGVSYAYISRIEAGARQPSVKALRLLAPKLGVSVEYLESGSDLREADQRELELAEAELQIRLGDKTADPQATLERILEEALSAGDSVAATRARVALGLSGARVGQDAAAIDHLEAALGGEPFLASARPDVYATLGRAYSNIGQAWRAVALFEGCLAEVTQQEPDDLGTQVRYATYLSYALTDAGEFERAESVLAELAERPLESLDPYTRVRVFWSLGRLETREGRAIGGLSYFRRAVALLEATEDTLHTARAHVSCAWALTKSSRAEEAGRHLELAEKLFGPQIEKADLGWLRTEQAKRAARLERADEAIVRAGEALEALGESDPAERGDAWWAMAEGYVHKNEIKQAEAAFAEAVALITDRRPSRDCAALYRAWANLLRRDGRESEALDKLEQATDLVARTTRSATTP
jgi:transcriptional regulator with XRE-family HTH domain